MTRQGKNEVWGDWALAEGCLAFKGIFLKPCFVSEKIDDINDNSGGIMSGDLSGQEGRKRRRELYRHHWFLGAFNDTLMPRRKWLKLVGSTIAASAFIRPSPAQKPTAIDVTIDEAGSPESWEGSHPLSPFSSLNLSTGNLFTSIPIVSFSGRGLSVSLTLFHNSASSSSLQPFGYGWTHSYNWKIQRDSQTGDAIVVRGTGRKHRYTYNAQSGTFTPPAGVYDELVRHPDGTWTLTFKDQTKMHFDSSGKLIAIVDKNENQVTLSYDSYGRLTQVQ
jgi:YD repeat-containing protein